MLHKQLMRYQSDDGRFHHHHRVHGSGYNSDANTWPVPCQHMSRFRCARCVLAQTLRVNCQGVACYSLANTAITWSVCNSVVRSRLMVRYLTLHASARRRQRAGQRVAHTPSLRFFFVQQCSRDEIRHKKTRGSLSLPLQRSASTHPWREIHATAEHTLATLFWSGERSCDGGDR